MSYKVGFMFIGMVVGILICYLWKIYKMFKEMNELEKESWGKWGSV